MNEYFIFIDTVLLVRVSRVDSWYNSEKQVIANRYRNLMFLIIIFFLLVLHYVME